MHPPELILTLTCGLAAALALGYLTHRLGLSPIIGYLLAGVAVGPHTPGFIADPKLAEQMAEIGVILLMFGVGLHFHFDELLAVRRIALPGAVGQSLVATGLGAIVAWSFGWGWAAGVVYGLALSVASTVVLTRVLSDNNELHTPTGHIAIGWLVVEDIFTVLVLVLLPPLFENGGVGVGLALGLAVLKLGFLMVVAVPVGGRIIPWLLKKVADTRSRELFTLTVLVVALGIAMGSALLFGVSMALGAFLAGMVVGRSDFSLRAATDALPMRDAFAVLFFVSIGMLFNPRYLIEAPWLLLATLAVVMLGKPLVAVVIVLVLGYPVRIALAVAVALAQIGEFSFILAALAISLKTSAGDSVLPKEAASALVVVSIVSIAVNPLLYRAVRPMEAWAMRRPRLWRWLTSRARPARLPAGAHEESHDPQHHAVVVGYGPVGQTVVRLLRENDITSTVIEMNLETVKQLQKEGVSAVYGDASHRDTLRAAGVHQAATLILSSSSLHGSEEVIRLARELNPDIRVLTRAAYLRERASLIAAGADEVITSEGEIALAMAEEILTALGATPEQIDRERERLREEGIAAREKTAIFEPPPLTPPPEEAVTTEAETASAPATAVSSEPDPGTRAE